MENPILEDLELQTECLVEVLELVDQVISDLIKCETDHNYQIPGSIYETVMRQMHSMKGVTGMIGLEPVAHLIHQTETFFSSTWKKGTEQQNLVLTMIKFWSEMESRLKKHSINLVDINRFSECLQCNDAVNCHGAFETDFLKNWNQYFSYASGWVENSSEKKAELLKREIVVVGSVCNKFRNLLEHNSNNWDCIPCVNSLYGKYDLMNLKAVFLMASSTVVNPFFSQLVIGKYAPHVTFCYIDHDGKNLIEYLGELESFPHSFCFISSKSVELYINQLGTVLEKAGLIAA